MNNNYFLNRVLSSQNIADFIRSPWAILISIIIGVLTGAFYPQIAKAFAPVGIVYLQLLKMCVLPILISAITVSVGRLMKTADAGRYITKILIVFSLGLLIVSVIAVTIALITNPGGNLNDSTLEALGIIIKESAIDQEIALTGPIPDEAEQLPALLQFVIDLVPNNIFDALTQEETLKILFFSITLGVFLGQVEEENSVVFSMIESIYNAFKNLISGLTTVLPIGLCSLLANQIAHVGVEVMLSMVNFLVIAIGTFILIYILSTLLIWQQATSSFTGVIIALKNPTMLALATRSSFACLPSAITAMQELLKFEQRTVRLVVPLAVTICRFGAVIYFGLASVFVAQLYEVDLGIGAILIIVVASIFAGMATAGVTGVLTLTMLSLVLDPLNLPIEAALVLFIAIDPIIDPFRTLSIVQTGMAASSVIAEVKTAEVKKKD